MPRLADTTLRLLGQEPLAGRVPTSEQLRLAELLDAAGFAYLEVSGGGCFEAAVRRGIESPWERIRAIRQRTRTPLALALRGRFLVGSRPVGVDFARRFIACAAESGIDVFRLHDPLNDVSNLREAAEAITGAGREFDAGLVYSPGRGDDLSPIVEQARALPELGAARLLVHDPSGSLEPHRAREVVEAVREASGLPVGIYCQGSAGAALASALEAARAGADLVACAIYPVALTLHRVSAETATSTLSGLGLAPGIDSEAVWRASGLVDEHLGDEPVARIAPRVAIRAARHEFPAGLVAALDEHLRVTGAPDRLEEVLEELARIREEVGSPPLASPIGQILANQAVVNVLSARRYGWLHEELRALLRGRYGSPAGPVDPSVLAAAERAGGELQAEATTRLDDVREQVRGLAASEEELLLVALFGDEAEGLLRAIRNRANPEPAEESLEPARAERVRELVELVQESGVGEVTVEDDGLRITVRRSEERLVPASVAPVTAEAEATAAAGEPASGTGSGLVRIESPMVGTFYRAPQPGAPPFVEVGDTVYPGQTLCILEAMKLMNEVKAELAGVVRRVGVQNAQPVEFGQVLFEVEPAA